MSIVLVGSTSGSVTLQEPAIAGTTVIDLPATSGTMVVTGGAQTVQFAAGSAAAPSITFTGDTNTGIFSPSADAIAFTEGGTESMRIDSSGNVGIGTTSPSTFNPNTSFNKNLTIVQNDQSLTLRSYWQSGVGQSSFIRAANASNSGITELSVEASQLTFLTAIGASGTERMRIDSSGNVGIGTSSPASKLHVVGSGNNGVLVDTCIRAYSANGTAYADVNYNGLNVSTNSGAMLFAFNQTERMRITSGGNVGIGTNNPTAKLQVSDGTTTLDLNPTGGVVYFGTSTNHPMIFNTNNTERMRITSGGELLIGRTASSSALLGITSSSGNTSINCGDAVDTTSYGILQIVRPSDQPDNKFHISIIRNGFQVAGLGFLDNSSTFAIQNSFNTSGAGVTLGVNATSWGTTSDERKKDVVGNVENALTKLADWRSVYYKYKIDEADTPQRVGLIAQDVQATLPEAISVEEDELQTLQLRYTEVIPVLVKAIQEQQQIINDLKARIETLESK